MAIRPSLLAIKPWFTLLDVIKRLDVEFEESVKLEDVLQLIGEGELRIAIDASGFMGIPLVRSSSPEDIHANETLPPNCHSPGKTANSSPISGWKPDWKGAKHLGEIYYLNLDRRGYYFLKKLRIRGDAEAFLSYPEISTREEVKGDDSNLIYFSWYLTDIEDEERRYMICDAVIDAGMPDFTRYEMVGSMPEMGRWVVLRQDLASLIQRARQPDNAQESQALADTSNPLFSFPLDNLDKKEIRALEVLGLAVITMKEKFPSLYTKPNGEPNYTQIAEEMVKHVSPGLKKMSHSKLSRMLSAAHTCYQSYVAGRKK